MPNLADPNYEPTDEELMRLATQAFVAVREAKARSERENEARRQRIAEAREKLIESQRSQK